MLQIRQRSASQAAVATGRKSMLAAASAELTRALDRSHAGYTFDTSLCSAVDVIVAELQREGQSIDDAMEVVGASVRVIRPSDTRLQDDALDRAWRSYFVLYDLSIQRTIRAFVIGSIEGDAGASSPDSGKACTWHRQV